MRKWRQLMDSFQPLRSHRYGFQTNGFYRYGSEITYFNHVFGRIGLQNELIKRVETNAIGSSIVCIHFVQANFWVVLTDI